MIDLLNLMEQDMLFYIVILVIIVLIFVLIYFIWIQSKEKRYSVNDIIEEKTKESIENDEEVLNDKVDNVKEVSNDTIELQNISKELETLAKNNKNDISMYESMQEETAIISYDELLSKTTKLNLEELNNNKENDEEDIKVKDYDHEESYLNDLKQLNDSLK